ncbi:zinc ribbon domain-containing protein [uncultured Megamonas sp.]|uniref:zinc ribbon domain-containing protein n=1 Tax=uncultured Megamonas sp. TaxID=286140 RepID=UPI00259588AF|nr:zinc ribbon domain-containing protein [uncultured Megamonas sp.]
MESVLKSLFKRELKAILAPYADIICALFIIAIIGYIIYYLYNKFNENKTKNNVNSIVNNSLKCPNCGLEISPEDRFCLKCGTALTPQTVNPSPSEKTFLDTLLQILKYTIIYALIGFVILFILLILIGVMAE